MIRTLIEITADEADDHERKLKHALGLLGFEPKDSADHVRFMSDLRNALNEKGIVPHKLVEEYRAKREVAS